MNEQNSKPTEQKQEQQKPVELEVNLLQEEFCQLYATDKEFFGNGVETYLEVYEIDKSKPNWYKTACSAASRLLSNVKVITRINEILEAGGLNDAFVDKQLQFLLTQHADFGNKLGAIKEYNKLKQRITEKIDHTTAGKPIPILNVQFNHSHNENKQTTETDTGGTGRDISVQDHIHITVIDSLRPVGQNTDIDEHSKRELPSPQEGGDKGLPGNNAGT